MIGKARLLFRAALVGMALALAWNTPTLGAAAGVVDRSARASEAYGKLPLSFEINRGQSDPAVKFLARGSDYAVYLMPSESFIALRRPAARSSRRPSATAAFEAAQAAFETQEALALASADGLPAAIDDRARLYTAEFQRRESLRTGMRPEFDLLRVMLLGASQNPHIAGIDPLPGRNNYFAGKDPADWRTGISTFAGVKYQGVYQGVDLLYHGNNRTQLEYDFVIAPGANPKQITLRFAGANDLRIDRDGNLVVRLAGSEVIEHAPLIYQETDDGRHPIAGGYESRGHNMIGFKLARYDRRRPLTIDPAMVYSTYLAGSGGAAATGVAVDASGNAYVTGTAVPPFPVTMGAYQTAPGIAGTSFISKLSSDGTTLLYSTYLNAETNAIAVDTAGNAYVTGTVFPLDGFPTTAGAFQTDCAFGDNAAFVTKLNASGSALEYSTCLSGGAGPIGFAIAVGSKGDAYVTGKANPGFPTTPGAYQTAFGGGCCIFASDAFVTKLNSIGSALVYSTFIGGKDNEQGVGIVLDSAGEASIAGDDFPVGSIGVGTAPFPTTPGAFQTNCSSNSANGFVSKLNYLGSALIYSTCLGGSKGTVPSAIALDAANNAYVVGVTESGFPTTRRAFQASPGSCAVTDFPNCDAFVSKLNRNGSALVYSTYIGGSGADSATSVVVDSSGEAILTGATSSDDFPVTTNAQQSSRTGTQNAFVSQLNAAGSSLIYSSYLGGRGADQGTGIQLDRLGYVYVVGSTTSPDFVTTPGVFQPILAGGTDAFVTKLAPQSGPANLSPAQISFGPVRVGATSQTHVIKLVNPRRNAGTLIINGISTGDSSEFVIDGSITTCNGAALVPGSSCAVGLKFNPIATGLQLGMLTVSDTAVNTPQIVSVSGTGQ